MITSSGFNLHVDTIALCGDTSSQRPPAEDRETIEAVVNDHVRAMLTSAHWNHIVDGSVPGDEITRELATLQPHDRISLQMYNNKIQMTLPNRRWVWLEGDRKYDLFNEHIGPKLQQMIDQVSKLAKNSVRTIYIEVELPTTQQLPQGDLRASDLSPPTSSRLLAREERRADQYRCCHPRPPIVHDINFMEFLNNIVTPVMSLVSFLFSDRLWRTTSGSSSEETN